MLPGVQRGGYLGGGEAGSREDWGETAASRQKGNEGGLDQESEKGADVRLSFPRLQRWERAGPAGSPRWRLTRDLGRDPRTSQAPGAAAWPSTSPDYWGQVGSAAKWIRAQPLGLAGAVFVSKLCVLSEVT